MFLASLFLSIPVIQAQESSNSSTVAHPNLVLIIADDMAWDLKNNKIKISNCWSIINYKYASNAAHTHGNSLISSAYYVQATKNCGNIVFDDPRPGAVMTRP